MSDEEIRLACLRLAVEYMRLGLIDVQNKSGLLDLAREMEKFVRWSVISGRAMAESEKDVA